MRSSHLFPKRSVSGWNWHLDIEEALQPVAVASSGQSLDHSRWASAVI